MLGERSIIELEGLRLITETPGLGRDIVRAVTADHPNSIRSTSAIGFELYTDGSLGGTATDELRGRISFSLGSLSVMKEIIRQLEEAQKPQS